MALDEEYRTQLEGQTVMVKYDPDKPSDSVVDENEVLGRHVIQENANILNPKVW